MLFSSFHEQEYFFVLIIPTHLIFQIKNKLLFAVFFSRIQSDAPQKKYENQVETFRHHGNITMNKKYKEQRRRKKLFIEESQIFSLMLSQRKIEVAQEKLRMLEAFLAFIGLESWGRLCYFGNERKREKISQDIKHRTKEANIRDNKLTFKMKNKKQKRKKKVQQDSYRFHYLILQSYC